MNFIAKSLSVGPGRAGQPHTELVGALAAWNVVAAHHLEVRAGARLLMENVSFRVESRVKRWVWSVATARAKLPRSTKILAGEALPASGTVQATRCGGLPAAGPPPDGDPEQLARERVLSARGPAVDAVRRLREAEIEMGSDRPNVRERAMRRYTPAQRGPARRRWGTPPSRRPSRWRTASASRIACSGSR